MEYFNKKLLIKLTCLLLTMSLSLPLAVEAKNKAEIVDVAVERGERNLEVSFRIENCFTPKMEEAIRSGVPTTFRIRIILEKPGSPFVRNHVVDFAIDHTIRYDRLKNAFRVQLPEHPEKELATSDFEEAKQFMSCVRELPIIPLWKLDRDETYGLRFKAELSKVRLPFFLKYIFFFVSMWDFETEWHKVTI